MASRQYPASGQMGKPLPFQGGDVSARCLAAENLLDCGAPDQPVGQARGASAAARAATPTRTDFKWQELTRPMSGRESYGASSPSRPERSSQGRSEQRQIVLLRERPGDRRSGNGWRPRSAGLVCRSPQGKRPAVAGRARARTLRQVHRRPDSGTSHEWPAIQDRISEVVASLAGGVYRTSAQNPQKCRIVRIECSKLLQNLRAQYAATDVSGELIAESFLMTGRCTPAKVRAGYRVSVPCAWRGQMCPRRMPPHRAAFNGSYLRQQSVRNVGRAMTIKGNSSRMIAASNSSLTRL